MKGASAAVRLATLLALAAGWQAGGQTVTGIQGIGFDRTRPPAGAIWKFNGSWWEPVPDLMYEGWENLRFQFSSALSVSIQAGTANVIAGCYSSDGRTILPDSIRVEASGLVTIAFGAQTSGWCVVNRSRQTILAGRNDNRSFSFSGQTSVTLTHGASSAVLVACYDQDGYQIYPDSIARGSGAATVNFAVPQSGRCVVNTLPVAADNPRANVEVALPAQAQVSATHNAGVRSLLVQCYDSTGQWFLPEEIQLDGILGLSVSKQASVTGSCVINRSSWGGPSIVAVSGLLTGTGTSTDPLQLNPATPVAVLSALDVNLTAATVQAWQCQTQTVAASGLSAGTAILAVWPALPDGITAMARALDGQAQLRLCNSTEQDISLPAGLQVRLTAVRSMP